MYIYKLIEMDSTGISSSFLKFGNDNPYLEDTKVTLLEFLDEKNCKYRWPVSRIQSERGQTAAQKSGT